MLCYTCEVFLMFYSLSKGIPTVSLWLDDAWGTCVTNGVVACLRARWYDKHHGRSTVHNKPTCSHQPRVGWYGSMYGFLEFFSLLACYPFIKNSFFQGSSKEHVCTDVKSFVSLETYVVLCLFFILLLSFFFPSSSGNCFWVSSRWLTCDVVSFKDLSLEFWSAQCLHVWSLCTSSRIVLMNGYFLNVLLW